MVSHDQLIEAFYGDVITAPARVVQGGVFSRSSARMLIEVGFPGSFDDFIVIDADFEERGPLSLAVVYRELGDVAPSRIAHLRRVASCGLDSICFDVSTDAVYLVPSASPEQATKIAASLEIFVEQIYAVKTIRNEWMESDPSDQSIEDVRLRMRRAVSDGAPHPVWMEIIDRVTEVEA
ncbi:SUKH-4 family immunity protein [Streptomyces sp. NPDC035033]|uniref:SUKH-4 family immunity protein n=1 Tax=Streptomyces sp. NPDC035033 TaxID=3155368 RepID=UPI0033CD1CC6